MIRLVRRLGRLMALAVWFCIAGLIALPTSLRRDWGATKKVTAVTQLWARGLARILGLRVTLEGDMGTFHGGLIVSNHLGYIDILTHATLFPLRFAPKSDIRKWFFLGPYIGLSHPIWVDRTSRHKSHETMHEFRETMKHEIPLIVYPEGTSTSGDTILPFKSTPFEAVIEDNCPILPVLTIYHVPEHEPTVCWYGDMTLLPHVWALLGIREIKATVKVLPGIQPNGRSRKEVADVVYQAMIQEYERFVQVA